MDTLNGRTNEYVRTQSTRFNEQVEVRLEIDLLSLVPTHSTRGPCCPSFDQCGGRCCDSLNGGGRRSTSVELPRRRGTGSRVREEPSLAEPRTRTEERVSGEWGTYATCYAEVPGADACSCR